MIAFLVLSAERTNASSRVVSSAFLSPRFQGAQTKNQCQTTAGLFTSLQQGVGCTRVSQQHPSIFVSRRFAPMATVLAAADEQEENDDGGSDKSDAESQPRSATGVTLKMAFDSSPAWGVADLSETKSERFTSPESLDMVHRLRRDSSAVLVGRATVERDDCTLTVRRVELGEGKPQPVRVVLDPSLRLFDGSEYTLLKDGLPTLIYFSQSKLIERGDGCGKPSVIANAMDSVTLVGLNQSSGTELNSLSPADVINDLSGRGLHHIMVEGGPATARSFLEAGVVDRAILVKAPIQFQVPVPSNMDEDTIKMAGLEKIGSTKLGGDSVEYWSRPGLDWPEDDGNGCMWP